MEVRPTEEELAVSERVEAFFLHESIIQFDSYSELDRGMAAFAMAMYLEYAQHIDGNPVSPLPDLFGQIVRERNKIHGQETLEYIFNLAVRSFVIPLLFDKHLLPELTDRFKFPEDYTNHNTWRIAVRSILENEVLRERWLWEMINANVQSNIIGREKGTKLVIAPMQAMGRLPSYPRIADGGTSQMVGLNKLASPEYSFEPIEVGRRIEPITARAARLIVDEQLARRVNHVITQPVPLGKSLGIDIVDISDPQALRRGEAHSAYISERTEEAMQEWRALAGKKNEAVDFLQADITKPLPDQIKAGSFDVYQLLTVLYQMTPAERQEAIKHAVRYTSPTGIIILQDFVKVSDKNPVELEFPDRFHTRSYAYRTLVLDMMRLELGFQEVARWNSGRCKKMLLGDLAVTAVTAHEIHAYLESSAV